MPAISVGSVEVDVIPSTRGIYERLRQGLTGPANRVGDEVGRIIGRHILSNVSQGFVDGVQRGGRQAQASATRQGTQTGSAFARGFKARLEAGLRDLPEVRLNANSTDAEREIANIRAQMTALRDVRIGIDISEADAVAAMDRLRERLARLSASSANVAVRVDAGAAAAQLAAFQAEVDRLDGRDVDVDTSAGVAGFNALTAAAVTFGPAILPVLPVVAAGLGGVAAAATAAGVGVGALALVAVPAFKQIGTVLQAQKAAQDAAAQSTSNGAAAAAQASSRALQLASAQQAVTAAERNGARQIAAAVKQVAQARQNAAQTAAQASVRSQQAARAVEDAERALSDAQEAATRAQRDLTAARRTAAQELEDLNNRLTDSRLSQRDAEIALREATADRDAVLKNANSTELDKQKALLAYDQAVQRLKEQTTETTRLAAETKAANKAGVDGSATVRTAQEQVAQAQQAVVDKTRALRDAQQEQARTAQQNAQQIAAAQQRIADAQEGVANAQQQAAEQAASAQRSLQQAQLSGVSTADAASTAQAKYRAELAKLSPAARATMGAYIGLRGAFSAWSKSLQPQVLPIFTRALNGMRSALPGLTPFVLEAADAVGELQDKASRGFKSQWWKTFVADLRTSVKPAILGLGGAFGDVFKGMVGVIDAFLPQVGKVGSGLRGVTKQFARWGTGLKGSPEFEKFMGFVADKTPLLKDLLGSLFDAFLEVGKALEPLSGPLLKFATLLIDGLRWLADKAPEVIQVLWGLYAVNKAIQLGMKAFAIAMGLYNTVIALASVETWSWAAAIQATGIVPLIELIVLAVVGLGVAVYEAYKHVGWFRAAVDASWAAIKTATLFLWNSVLKPAFAGIWSSLQMIGQGAMWLWNTVLKPVFSFISLAVRILAAVFVTVLLVAFKAWWAGAKTYFRAVGALGMWLWNSVLSPVVGWIVGGLKAVGSWGKWLWQKAIRPAWLGIQAGTRALWATVLKPVFRAIQDGVKEVGKWVRWLYSKTVKPVWSSISSASKSAWEHGIRPVFDSWKRTLRGMGDVFKVAVGAIKRQWDRVEGIAKKPVAFVINTVYNKGIVGTWNKVAKAFGAPTISEFHPKGFARGGVLAGQSSYRQGDDQLVPMRRGEGVYVSEAMRDPYERARLHAVNAAAMRGQSLSPYQGGGYAKGGIFGWVGSAASKVGDLAKSGVAWLKDGIKASAVAGLNSVVKPLISKISGSASLYRDMITKIPERIIKSIVGYSGKADTKLEAAGIGGGGFKKGLSWARTQAGKRYQWGGNGNPSWDCSGFVSAIESVIRGQSPHRRWATGAFSGATAPPGWVLNKRSPYMIGITNSGVGHTAGTLGKTNVESRGGDGVIVGPRARGYKAPLFGSWYGFQPGKYDSGGFLQPGLNLAYNGTGRPEPVFTTQQANALARSGGSGGGPASFEGNLYLDSGEFLGRVRGEAQQVVNQNNGTLLSALKARPRG
ncbi:ATP synthase F0 subunit B [Streptomyces sp. C1-2]|uniref:ATP synthase F0 subunit B n=1 Tax=Streptomyces sp. C1-2 TaxID=2720022 RepID=UPI0014324380|nr:ATP synthase F0 subunit B [Streptomyces sp. C1-2]NJP72519.1 hypothetical protein [Streptomyces sp. C1-2]